MSIPDFQTLMLPALRVLADGENHRSREMFDRLAGEFHLTPDERSELLASGRMPVFNSRVHWAVTYMVHAGLVERPMRATWRATAEGRALLAEGPARVDVALLRRYPHFVAWHRGRGTNGDGARRDDVLATPDVSIGTETPDEALERIERGVRRELSAEILAAIADHSSSFFERLVVELLVKMGYGGSFEEAAKVTKRSGDGGIDGIIKADRLGLETVYLQAKRWEAVVGRPEIQKFAGSLEGERARKGVFITTSSFSPDARDYVSRIDKKIVLIDGSMLADLMIEHQLGVSEARRVTLYKLDQDYFEEE